MSIRRFKPDFVHSLEFQGAGYLSLRAFGSIGGAAPNWIVTNWGSDIYWFERFPQHRKKIIQILSKADRYSAECVRDVELAIKLGFRGHVLPVLPNAGGFSDEILSRNLLGFESRKVIAVKGYHGWAGRAKVALGAIGQMADELSDYEVIVFSADRDVAKLARKISKQTGMTITCHRKKKLTHDQVLEILATAVVYIGVSRTDGISTSMLEAMALGAIPIQTSSACCSEWFDETGVAIDEISTTAVQMAIRRGISLAKDPINIQQNRHTVKQRAEEECIKKMALTFYE